ncbi:MULTISPECIES: hypothetical protein [unclassified Streptosporangium]|uniref:hypothetical protein n=1 Tax=unclassified Streptosporangium TaxID=2632669 RepID=UPI002E296254|nr:MULTISPECIES: hypothetical protein [unclassified Streptosporangium]
MNNPNAPVLDRTTASGCGCFAESPPLPMGCADCGHAPYAHGCPGRPADHEYAQPSAELMAVRLEARRLGVLLPAFVPTADEASVEAIPLVPAQGRPEPPVPAAPAEPLPKRAPRPSLRSAARPATAPPRRDDSRRPAPRPVETAEDRAARLALARDPRSRRRARTTARAHGGPPSSTSRPTTWPPLTLLPNPLDHQTLRPGPAVAPGRGHSPDTPPPRRHQPSRREVAA